MISPSLPIPTLLTALLAALAFSHAKASDNEGLIPVTDHTTSLRDVERFKQGQSLRGEIAREDSRIVWFGAEMKDGRFPDIELSLGVVNRQGDADLYCSPLNWIEILSRSPGPSLYAWKAVYTQNSDELFLSSKSKPYMAAQMNVTKDGEEKMIVAFGCAIYGISWEATEFEFSLDLSYNERTLVEEEKVVMKSLYDQCCQGQDSCSLWRANGTDSTEDNAKMEDGHFVEMDFCHRPGSLCTDEGRLRKLDMRNYKMKCEVPVDELVILKELKKIDLDGNTLTGLVADVVGKLGNLPHMDRISISDNGLHGDLDGLKDYCHIFKPGGLSYLDLASNFISGKLLPCFFSGESSIGKVTSGLLELRLSENAITGTIPDSMTAASPLELLDLDHNDLQGELPKSLGDVKYMRTLRFSHNQLEGPVPDNIGNIPSLLLLSGTGNKFSSLPPSWNDPHWQPPGRLKFVDFADNDLDGPFPAGLGNSNELLGLQLGGNRLSGPLEFEDGMFHSMLVLNISFNLLTGVLPDALRNLSAFSFVEGDPFPLQQPLFDFRFNLFSGELPDFFYLDHSSSLFDPIIYLAGNNDITCGRPEDAHQFGIDCVPSETSDKAEATPVVSEDQESEASDQSMFLPDTPPDFSINEPTEQEPQHYQPPQVAPHEQAYPALKESREEVRPVEAQETSKSRLDTGTGIASAVVLFLVIIGAFFVYKRVKSRKANSGSTPAEDVMGYALMDKSRPKNVDKENLLENTAQSSSEV